MRPPACRTKGRIHRRCIAGQEFLLIEEEKSLSKTSRKTRAKSLLGGSGFPDSHPEVWC